jgi:GH24 family phage-related lysozyme (muramidase)
VTTLARWRALLKGRRALLAVAERQAAYWRKRKAAAKPGAAYSHAGAMLADREAKVRTRKSQVAYAERVVARNSAATDLSSAGLSLIERFEGLRLAAYHLPGETYWTIGYGHYGPDVRPGSSISQAQAVALLRGDVATAVKAVRALGLTLTQGEFDALVSIAFNCGGGVLGPSTSLGQALRRHDLHGAADALLLYVHGSNGVRLQGLVDRRQAERALFVA